MQIWVDTSEVPARLTLNWLKDPDATTYFVFKKAKTATAWGTAIATVSKDSTRYVDNNVQVGKAYEYRISKTSPLGNGFGYVYAAMKLPPTEWKGSILLLVDSTVNIRLKTEIDTWKSDLANEAWHVLTHVPSAKHTVKDIRTKISEIKSINPDLKTVFILGHIKVPYSGNTAPDGHQDHIGAWPSDTYYADLNGSWTDVTVDNVTASRAENKNIPGDGKFDQNNIPTDAELEVGRVDFFNMPAFSKNEIELLRAYLNKNHKWRTGQIIAEKRGIVLDNFNFQGEAFGQSGIKNFSVLFHPSNVEYGNYRDSLRKKSYLCSYGSGGGWYEGAGGISTTQNMAVDSLQTVFTFLFGSYFGDWDSPNNFLRAALASGTVLTNAWAGRPHWSIHHMAMGDHIGYSTRLTMNNTSALYNAGNSARAVHVALMGDPSLMMYPIPAVPSLKLSESGGSVKLLWNKSADATHGYYVYRKILGNTVFDVIARNVVDTFYKDSCVAKGFTYEYIVRAVKLESNASGSFFNLSAGARDTISKINDSAPQADFSFVKDYEFIHFKSESKNVRNVKWIIGKDTLRTNEVDAILDCSLNPQEICLIVQGECDVDQVCKTISFDCSIPNVTKQRIDSIKCFGGTGSIEIQDLQGADPFDFKWNTGNTTNKLSNVSAGIYTVTISSAKNTENIYVFELTQPEKLAAAFTVRPADPGKKNGGLINLVISGGTLPYTFQVPNEKLDSLAVGVYDLIILDGNGCQLLVKINIPVKTFTNQIAKPLSIELYPSPTKDYITIKQLVTSKIEKFYLIDVHGNMLKEISNSSERINVSMLTPGWYMIQCITKEGVEYYPFEKI